MFQPVHRDYPYAAKKLLFERFWGDAKRFPLLAHYGAAAASVGVAMLATGLVAQSLGQTLYSLFFAAVMVSTWFGGVGPGVLATVLSTVCLDLLTSSNYEHPSGFFRIAVYFLVALLTNSLIGERNRAAEELRRARDGLEARVRERTAELAETNDRLRSEIADRTEAEAQLAKVTDELIERNAELWRLQGERARVERLAALGRVTGTIAHELGTPLNSVLGYTQLLAQENLSDDARRRLNIVAAQVQRIVSIIDRHLSRARGSLPKHHTVDLNRTLAETVELFKPVFEQRGINVRLSVARDLPAVRGDDASLQRVLINLLDNAFDALADGGNVVVSTRKQEDATVVIEVGDDGTGIAEDMLPNVFDLFVTSKPAGKGTGLGLAISQEIVRSHGGSLKIASQSGRGTTVAIVLPAEVDAAATTRRNSSESQDSHCR
jgi:signal transduction histidine kinase